MQMADEIVTEKEMKKLYLGIDTSNYTTSVSVCDAMGSVLANIKYPLPVPKGGVGLRQSDAVFAHIKNLPQALLDAKPALTQGRLAAVGVSEKPRDEEGSYMPCFLAGVAAAQSAAVSAGVPLYRFSHQSGHIMAVYAGFEAKGPFMAYHVSGGTTEMLLCEKKDTGFNIQKIGGTEDLNAGQVIDRVGAALGCGFPCGNEVEGLALRYGKPVKGIHVSIKGNFCNLSGLENLAKRALQETGDREYTAAFVLEYIAKTLLKMTENALSENGCLPLLFAGGVMSNSIIKERIKEKYPQAYFAPPSLSADNACGIALLARQAAGERA